MTVFTLLFLQSLDAAIFYYLLNAGELTRQLWKIISPPWVKTYLIYIDRLNVYHNGNGDLQFFTDALYFMQCLQDIYSVLCDSFFLFCICDNVFCTEMKNKSFIDSKVDGWCVLGVFPWRCFTGKRNQHPRLMTTIVYLEHHC